MCFIFGVYYITDPVYHIVAIWFPFLPAFFKLILRICTRTFSLNSLKCFLFSSAPLSLATGEEFVKNGYHLLRSSCSLDHYHFCCAYSWLCPHNDITVNHNISKTKFAGSNISFASVHLMQVYQDLYKLLECSWKRV